MTVVVEGASGEGRSWVGRYHETSESGLVLHDVAVYDPATAGLPRAEWVAKQRRFGVRIDARRLTVPRSEVGVITRLQEWTEGPIPPSGSP